MITTQSDVIQVKKPLQASIDREQKVFNRLKKKIETLQKDLQEINRDLDQCLAFYHAHIQPAEKLLADTSTELVKILYRFYKNPGRLSGEDLQYLKRWILNAVERVFNLTASLNEVDSEMKDIFQELEGISYEEIVSDQLQSLKDEMQQMFKQSGIEIDLSAIDIHDDQRDIARKLFESASSIKDKQPPPKPKSKKQLQKELKERQLEEIQKRGLSSIYKQLARVLHPDLEQDSVQKAEKEALMKKLTTAYKDEDLYTLLSLEIEWMHRSSHQPTQKTGEQLKVYNAILKEQVATLKESINRVMLHPKYLPLEGFFEGGFFGIIFLKMAYNKIKGQEQQLQAHIKQLNSSHAEKYLQQLFRKHTDKKS